MVTAAALWRPVSSSELVSLLEQLAAQGHGCQTYFLVGHILPLPAFAGQEATNRIVNLIVMSAWVHCLGTHCLSFCAAPRSAAPLQLSARSKCRTVLRYIFKLFTVDCHLTGSFAATGLYSFHQHPPSE